MQLLSVATSTFCLPCSAQLSQADVNVVSVASRRSALYTATVCGHEDAARRLVLGGADVNFEDPVQKSSVMCKAMLHGHHMLVNELLLAGVDLNSRTALRGNTPLHMAAREGMDNLVSSLLLRGADKDALNVAGETPLMHASKWGHLSVVHILLAAGADVTLWGKLDRSALGFAAKYGHVDVLEAIVGHGADVNARHGMYRHTALHIAACRDGAGAVDALIEVGADVNAKAEDGATPIMYATWFSRRSNSMRALLEGGASLTEEDSEGNTALHTVCLQKHEGVATAVDLLLRWGADDKARNAQNMDPVYLLRDQYYEVDPRVCTREEFDRASLLLAWAQEDRTWRRRCFVMMLRSRAKAARARGDGITSGGERDSSATDDELGEGRKVARRENEATCGGGVGNGESGRGSFSGLMELVWGLETETVFRTIVGFL